MSKDRLSQDEIDLLFNAPPGVGMAGSVEEPQNERLQTYDFRQPHRISKERMRTLEAVYSLLAKSLEHWLTGRVREAVEMELLGIEQLTFGEFVLSLPTPCASYIFDISGSDGEQGIIDFSSEFAFFLVDRLLGGSSQSSNSPERALTPLERMVVRLVADRAATSLEEAWQDHFELGLTYSGFESIPDMLQTANRQDSVMVANIEVSAGKMQGLLTMCLPFDVLDRFFAGAATRRPGGLSKSPEEQLADREGVEAAVRAALLPVTARLPAFRLSMGDLMQLEPGSVLLTGLETSTNIEVIVSGQKRFEARPGRVGNKVAVQVTDVVDPEEIRILTSLRPKWMR